LILHNASASTLTLSNQSGSEATAANKIITGTGADLPVPTNTSVTMQYDGTASRWRITGSSNSANTLAAGSTGQVQFNGGTNLAADSNLFWDNTNKRLGIGTASPSGTLHVYNSATNTTSLLVEGASDTGTYASQRIVDFQRSDGRSLFYIDTQGLENYGKATAENINVLYQLGIGYDVGASASGPALAVNGNVGIGTASPATGIKADINGLVKIAGTGSETCSASTVGAMRYNAAGNYMEICSYP
jgi:hypothetical protein